MYSVVILTLSGAEGEEPLYLPLFLLLLVLVVSKDAL